MDAQLKELKKIEENTVITVKYGGLNANGKLIQPVYMRIRKDV